MNQRLLHHREAQAAILGRNAQSTQAKLAHAVNQVLGYLASLLNLFPDGVSFLLDKTAHRVLQQPVLFCNPKIHYHSPFSSMFKEPKSWQSHSKIATWMCCKISSPLSL